MTDTMGTSPFVNHGRVLRLSAMRYGNQPALEVRGTTITFVELNRQVNQMANALKARGVEAGDRIVLCAPNGADYVRVLFAAAKLGAVCVPVNTGLIEADLAFVLQATLPRLIAGADNYQDRLRGAVKRASLADSPALVRLLPDGLRSTETSDPRVLSFVGESDDEPPPPPVLDSDPAILLFTSGSMGTPKAVTKSYSNITWHALNRQISQPRREGARELFVLPLGGVGFGNFLLTDIMVGATCVLEPAFDAAEAVAILRDRNIEFVFLAPTMMMAMDAVEPGCSFPSVRVLETAYEVTMAQRERIAAMFPSADVLYSYGCTEGSMARAPASAFLEEPTNVGYASGLDEYRVRPGEDGLGEIEVFGPTVMQGYLTQPGSPPADDVRDGWFPTGDLGRQADDGAVHFSGRVKDMIKTGAMNVFAWDVEQALVNHEAIAGVAVIGQPDDYWGEAVVAVVQVKPGKTVTERQLRSHAEQSLAGFKRPKSYYVVDELPMNAGGKLAKGQVRTLVESGTARPLKSE